MGTVKADISVSLDGFVTGPNAGRTNPLGDDGTRLHGWLYELESWREMHHQEGGQRNRDAEVLAEAFEGIGAIVMGRGMFENGEEPWGPEPPFEMPVFVLTHEDREPLVKGATTFTFLASDAAGALERAREAAGDEDVSVAGGANVIQQFLEAGLLDQLQIHLIPIALGAGTPLFDRLNPDLRFEVERVVDSPAVTHIRYRVVR